MNISNLGAELSQCGENAIQNLDGNNMTRRNYNFCTPEKKSNESKIILYCSMAY
jgi:hypothetical protein